MVPGSPDNRLLVFDRLTPMNREFSDLSIVSSGDVRTWAFRAVEHGKNWIMGGTVKPGGALSVRVPSEAEPPTGPPEAEEAESGAQTGEHDAI